MCIRADGSFFGRFSLIGSARALYSRGCNPIAHSEMTWQCSLSGCGFSAPKTLICFQLSQSATQSPARSEEAQGGRRQRFEYGNGKSGFLLPHGAENPRKGAAFAVLGAAFVAPGAVFQVHGSVNTLRRGAALSCAEVRFSHSQDCESLSVVAFSGENVPLYAELARENWFRARYGAVNRAVARSMAHCRDRVNLLIL